MEIKELPQARGLFVESALAEDAAKLVKQGVIRTYSTPYDGRRAERFGDGWGNNSAAKVQMEMEKLGHKVEVIQHGEFETITGPGVGWLIQRTK